MNSTPSAQRTHFVHAEGYQVTFHFVSFTALDWSKHPFQSYLNPAPSTSLEAK